jgi:carboxylesterase
VFNAFEGEEHRAFFRLAGGGRAALLVHGFPGSAAEMRPLADILHADGWTTQGLLLPGFGPEIATLGERSVSEWSVAVTRAVADLRAEHQTVILVGNSMGGALSIAAAASAPVEGLVLFAPFYTVDNLLWKALPVLRYVIPKFKPFKVFKPDFTDPEFQEGTRNFLPDADFDDPEFQRQTLEFEVDTRIFANIRAVGVRAYASAPDVRVPSLVIQGDADDLVTPENTRKLINRLGSSPQYLEVAASHNPLDPDAPYWDTVVNAIRQFTRQLQTEVNQV